MSDKLTGAHRIILIRVKIERAKEHLVQLVAEAEKFRGKNTYAVGPKYNPETGERRINRMEPLPIPNASFRLLAIAGDVIHNLRCALDHLAYQLVLAAGVPETEVSTKVGFPIFGSAEIYETAKVRKVQGMRPEAKEAIDRLKPYKGGNEQFWRLHKLDCTDKHHFLLAVGYDYLLQGVGFEGDWWLVANAPPFKGIFSTDMQDKSQLAVPETLGKTQVTQSDTLLETLHQLIEFVENLVFSFEPLLD